MFKSYTLLSSTVSDSMIEKYSEFHKYDFKAKSDRKSRQLNYISQPNVLILASNFLQKKNNVAWLMSIISCKDPLKKIFFNNFVQGEEIVLACSINLNIVVQITSRRIRVLDMFGRLLKTIIADDIDILHSRAGISHASYYDQHLFCVFFCGIVVIFDLYRLNVCLSELSSKDNQVKIGRLEKFYNQKFEDIYKKKLFAWLILAANNLELVILHSHGHVETIHIWFHFALVPKYLLSNKIRIKKTDETKSPTHVVDFQYGCFDEQIHLFAILNDDTVHVYHLSGNTNPQVVLRKCQALYVGSWIKKIWPKSLSQQRIIFFKSIKTKNILGKSILYSGFFVNGQYPVYFIWSQNKLSFDYFQHNDQKHKPLFSLCDCIGNFLLSNGIKVYNCLLQTKFELGVMSDRKAYCFHKIYLDKNLSTAFSIIPHLI